MSIGLITALMFLCMLVGMVVGFDLAFLLGAIAVIFTFFLWSPGALGSIANNLFYWITQYTMICMPLFIFMAFVLEKSGIAEALYDAMYKWMGRLQGGLAMGTVAICTLFAAMSGGAMMAVATLGIIAQPNMLKRGYDKHIVMGGIMAGAALGALIPPSIIMIIYALFSGESIGAMFIGGIIPGLILSSMFITYIGVRCYFNRSLGPAIPPTETIPWKEKFTSTKSIILPVLLVIAILGSIFFGIATPTEASAVGALGAIISAAINKRLNWPMIKDASIRTFTLTITVLWIVYGASVFAMVYQSLGATDLIAEIMSGLEVNRWVILIIMQLTFFVLGCILVNTAILLLCLPVYLPIITLLGFDPLWFGLLFVINMEMALLTPPFGFTLFYMRAVAAKEITMGDIYISIVPFVILQGIGLALCMVWPQIILYLPSLMIRGVGT
ncbi:TRAP transporter large permease subunit [Chloroflexota bacterium]